MATWKELSDRQQDAVTELICELASCADFIERRGYEVDELPITTDRLREIARRGAKVFDLEIQVESGTHKHPAHD